MEIQETSENITSWKKKLSQVSTKSKEESTKKGLKKQTKTKTTPRAKATHEARAQGE